MSDPCYTIKICKVTAKVVVNEPVSKLEVFKTGSNKFFKE
jgi:hypothetical protein